MAQLGNKVNKVNKKYNYFTATLEALIYFAGAYTSITE